MGGIDECSDGGQHEQRHGRSSEGPSHHAPPQASRSCSGAGMRTERMPGNPIRLGVRGCLYAPRMLRTGTAGVTLAA